MTSSSVSPVPASAARELARASPAGLAYVASQGRWLPARHLLAISEQLCRVERGEIDRLMIFQPPRSGKSMLTSEFTPAWFLGRNPDKRVILCSYGAHLASNWGRKSRDNLAAYGPEFFGVHVATQSKAADHWNIAEETGGMNTAGVGGPITGFGADLLIIDDPLKDAEEAGSEVIRAKQIDWWQAVARTRLMAGGAVVLMQCMTGDTPVLMGDGREKPLREVRPGDTVATYENGAITAARVRNWANQGADAIYTIRMKSGTAVRANARHPFLTIQDGVETWQRTDTLKKGSSILRVTGGSGVAFSAPPQGATSPRDARACACRTTTSSDGRTGSGPPRPIPRHTGKRTSVIATGSAAPTLTGWSRGRVGSVPFAGKHPPGRTREPTGTESSVSTTAARQGESAACCATTATSPSVTAKQKQTFWLPPPTYAIEPDEVAEVLPCGVEEVYDLQVDRTENFIANGLVSHNTRWHEEDLAGWLLEDMRHGGDQWEVLSLPAIAEEEDQLGREVGEALWPSKFPLADLERTKRALGGYYWAALYQQHPVPAGGALFKRHDFRYFTEDPEHDLYIMKGAAGEDDKPVGRSYCYRFVTCDPAFSEKETADYTALGLWAVTPWMDLLLLDVARIRFDVENLPAAIHRHFELWKPNEVRIETKAYGTRVINALVTQGLPVVAVDADTDKVTRALSAVPRYEAHAVYHRQGGEYVYDYEREILHFPSGAHDDQVDMFAYAALALPELSLVEVRQESMGQTRTGGLKDQAL